MGALINKGARVGEPEGKLATRDKRAGDALNTRGLEAGPSGMQFDRGLSVHAAPPVLAVLRLEACCNPDQITGVRCLRSSSAVPAIRDVCSI